MSELVDRVTTAIFVAIAKKMKTDPICPAAEVARAAIAAMREPTIEMVKAGCRAALESGELHVIFSAMIDEALK